MSQTLQVRHQVVPAPLKLNPERQITTTYLVNPSTGERYEYPRCMFDGTWKFAMEKYGRGGGDE